MPKNGTFQDPFSTDQEPPKDEGLPKNADERDDYVEPDENAVPTGSAKEVLDWVDGDKDRAERAFNAEQEKEKPRVGLTNDLLDLLEK